jgi:hexosaminidase
MLRSTLRRLSILALGIAGCARAPRTSPVPTTTRAAEHAVIPAPASVHLALADSFTIDSATTVVIDRDASAEVERVATYLSALLAPAGPATPRRLAGDEAPPVKSIRLRIDPTARARGPEGYDLTITHDRVTLEGSEPAGLFYGVQTMRLLLPASVEHPAALSRSLKMPVGRITDAPRFAWRGAMLDVSRHFLPARDVKGYIDLMALYKLNRLHLHLADDQGWRLEIKSRPNLAAHGGSTQVGGGVGGYYSQAEFADLVAYAASRFVGIVPEIDMPSHTNAALASYAELNCDGAAPPLYTGTNVGFSILCVAKDSVYTFLDDVIREIAALTPGPYFHIGGDEVTKLTHDEYLRFIERVQAIVRAHGKEMIGWGEIAPASLVATTVVQNWKRDSSALHAARGGKVILSPAAKVYLDMKYDSSTVLGLRWAGLIEVRDAYVWEPATFLVGVPESAVLGVEAPLWSESLVSLADFEFMAFPRLAAVAEVGWSPAATREWDNFRLRLAAHGSRLTALGVNFYRSPQIPWVR